MRLLYTSLVTLIITLSATFSSAAIITKDIEYKDGDVKLRGTLSYDDSIKTLTPAILLIPEWWGHNNYIKNRTKEMAGRGYIAFSIDMYGMDKETNDPKEAQSWSKPFYEDRQLMIRRAQAGLNILKQQEFVDSNRIVALGFCMGGTVALQLARTGENLAGVAAFHAGLQFPDPVKKGQIKASLLVLNGGADPLVPFTERQKFIEDMQTAGADLQFIEYGGAMHAFTNQAADTYNIPGVSYDPDAERRSFLALKQFLVELFGGEKN